MPDDLQENQGGATAVAEPPSDPADLSVESEDGASGPPGELDPAAMSADLSAFMRGVFGQEPPEATSKPDSDEADVQSAPPDEGDEAASAPERGPDGRFIPRRGIPKAVEERDARIADLERQLAERDPEQIRAQLRAQDAQQAIGRQQADEAALYEQAIHMADSDPRLVEPVPGDPKGRNLYQWREDRKELIAQYPEADAAMRAEAQRRISADRDAFRGEIRAQITAVAAEHGVDPETWKRSGTDWASMTRDCVEARVAPLTERIAQLERELHHARTSGLGAARAPAAAGRSAPGTPPRTMNDWLRGE